MSAYTRFRATLLRRPGITAGEFYTVERINGNAPRFPRTAVEQAIARGEVETRECPRRGVTYWPSRRVRR